MSAQDETVGQLIWDVMEEVGADGVVTVEEGKSIWLEKEVVTGMQFANGYLSPYFVTDSARMESVLENTPILITDTNTHIDIDHEFVWNGIPRSFVLLFTSGKGVKIWS